MRELQSRWERFISSLGCNYSCLPWKWIEKAYSEKDRYFHGFKHIGQCLSWVYYLRFLNQENRHFDSKDLDVVEMAIWCHDLVFHPSFNSSKNEEESAELAVNICGLLDLPESFRKAVNQAILSTNRKNDHGWFQRLSKKGSEVDYLVNDIDYNYFSLPNLEYLQIEKEIRKENDWMPEEDYREIRKQLLNQLLSYGIYNCEIFRKNHEENARKNIQSYLNSL